jgi:secreted trypsin-like serine protease
MLSRIRLWATVAPVAAAASALSLLGGASARAVIGDTVDDTVHPFTARVNTDAPGVGLGCSGALVAPSWVLTAGSCVDGAGAPGRPITVTLGGAARAVTWVAPHADRGVALLRLRTPVTTVAPVALGTTPAAGGTVLRLAGYGRTATTWVPDRKHVGVASVQSVDATTITVAGTDAAAATTCKGDAGGPALRETAAGVELVGVHRESSQYGCLAAAATDIRTAVETRTDDLAGWIRSVAVPVCGAGGAVHTADQAGTVVRTADVTGDCKADIINQNIAGELHAWASTGNLVPSGLFLGSARLVGGGWSTTNIPRIVTGDFTGDGKADIIGQAANGELRAWASTGDLSADGKLFAGAARIVGAGWSTTNIPRIVTGDFTGDGKADIIGQAANGDLRAWASTGDLSADNKLFTGAARIVATGWTTAAVPRIFTGDVDGDGRIDLIGQSANGELRALASTGDLAADGRLFAAGRLVGSGWAAGSYPRVIVGDVTGDGKADIINQNTAGELRAWASTGDLSADVKLFTGSARVVGSGWSVGSYPRLIAGDFTGDGRADLLNQNPSGQLHGFPSTGDLSADDRLFTGAARLVGAGWTLSAYPRIF